MKRTIFTLISSAIFLSSCTSQTGTTTQPSTPPASNTPTSSASPSGTPTSGALTVKFAQVKDIMDQRCTTCHSATSSDKSFGNMAGGVSYDTPELIKAKADRIKARTVITKDMPKGNNKTNMTQEERDLIGKWVDEGANIN